MTTSTAWKPTRWEIERLREGKAYRDAHPSTTAEDRANDAALDAWLERAEAAYAAEGARPETGQDVGELQIRAQATRDAYGRVGSTREDGPTEKQLGYIAKLARDLGHELETPRDKRHASLIIDKAKAELAKPRRPVRETKPVERLATEGQIAFMRDLWVTREHAGTTPVDEVNWAEITFAAASILIETLLAQPRRTQAAPEHGIREGRYAYRNEAGEVSFYRVTRTGRIKVIAGPQEHPYNGKLNEALLAIKADTRAAAALYGQEIGHCGRCGLRLSDKTSRERGLGPDCAQKTEW